MILVIDTWGGLCNQFYDIICSINFCLIHRISFSFRHCAFREESLVHWRPKPFHHLFDMSFLAEFGSLYKDYSTLELRPDNTFNIEGVCAIRMFTDNFLQEILAINKDFVVVNQFWAVYKFQKIIKEIRPAPAQRLMDMYVGIRTSLFPNNEPYNFLHYRYEKDFTTHFKCTVPPLKLLLGQLQKTYKNPELRIYVAASNAATLIDSQDPELSHIVTKQMDQELNFEEWAFIDYMIGLHSAEVMGHKKSSFSIMLNSWKGTSNYYAD